MNQNAIRVEQSKFADLLESMGDDALYQRFTIIADAPKEPALNLEPQGEAPGTDGSELAPTEVTNSPESDEVKISRFALGTNVIVERNVYDENNEPTGQVTPDTGWTVARYDYKNGKEVAIVTKETKDGTLSKPVSNAELASIQAKYSPESAPQKRPEAIVRKTGNEELKAAGIIEPAVREASAAESEVDETTQPRVDAAWDAIPYVEEPKVAEPEVVKTPVTPQEKYDAAKKELNDFIAENELSSDDVFYLEQYAEAGDANYNKQGEIVTKMSAKALDFAGRFQKLYDEKKRLRG